MLLIAENATGGTPVQSSFSFVVKWVSMLVIVKLWELTRAAGKIDSLHFLHGSVAPFYKPVTSPIFAVFCHLKASKDVSSLLMSFWL